MSFSFSSVDDFLRKARSAKQQRDEQVSQHVHDYLDDPHLVGVSPELAGLFEKCLETYGDEALRQIALFCLGKWFAIHTEVVEQFVATQEIPSIVSASMDAARISDAITLIETVGSFGGDDSWKQMLHRTIVDAVKEADELGGGE